MANAVRRESPSAKKARGAMGKIVAMSLAAMAAFLAHGAWYDDPVVKSTQSSGYENTGVHYINLSEDGKYLMVNLHSSNDAYPVQVYDVAELTAAKGEILDLTCPEVLPTTFSWGSGVNGWKGGAISSALGLMIPGCNGGNGGAKTDGAVFTSLAIPNTTWIANNNAFQLSGLGTGGIDGMDFNASGTRLFGNQYSANRGNLVVFDTATLKTDHALTLLETVTTPATRIRNLSCYTIGGKDLVYFGEGNDKGNGKVYVYDSDVGVIDLGTTAVNGQTVTNVKLSGTKTTAPTMYVLTDEGQLFIYTLTADGKALVSATPTVLDNATVNRLCGVMNLTSKFRNFEVTDDGEYAFFMHQSMEGAGGPDLCVVAAAVPESTMNIWGDANSVRTANGQKTVLTFSQSGKMYVAGSGTVEILLVGGGGGGGANHPSDTNKGGGGGGAGGVVHKTSFNVKEGIYDVTIGAGGAVGVNGGETTIVGLGLTAYGGGAGGQYSSWISGDMQVKYGFPGADGASGGGGTCGNAGGKAIYADQENLGHDGGTAKLHAYAPAGGGGAGVAAAGSAINCHGGDGVEIAITGAPIYYGGGGSGYRGGQNFNGGKGGGGYCVSAGNKKYAGEDGLGGGGCGGTKGGSGVVIVSFHANEKVCSEDFEVSGSNEKVRLGGDSVLKFTETGTTLTVKGYGAVELLMVGGGGGGGANHATDLQLGGGGGGAGGVLHKRSFFVAEGDYAVTIGAGGAVAANGGNTVIDDLGVTAYGGGAGGQHGTWNGSTGTGNPGKDGASGGGGTYGKAGGKAIYADQGNLGHDGGAAKAHPYAPAGGGGARAAAVGSTVNNNGADGVAIAITGTPVYYGGGGSGFRAGQHFYGGNGGGGSCGVSGRDRFGTDGLGGGGSGGAKGGCGVVIVRYTRPKKGLVVILR